ncbi:hypothetical protein AX15_005735 [Amanita polypyramis BW_CC]|nr:hypothetical protein AX15_005735 [Amanita polypyramis BW_CC]
MDAFSRLLSLDVSALPQNLTISITLRSVEAIADYLDFLLLSNKAHGLHHKKRLEALNSCLHYVLTHGVPLVVRFSKTSKRKRKRDTDDLEPQENPIDRFLELLRSRIFNHIVTTISYLSEVYLTRLLFPNASISHVTEVKHPGEQHDKPQTTPNDLRAGIVYIFESSVYLLCASLSSVTGVAKQSYATKLSTLCTSLMLSTSYELDKAIFRSSIALPLDALDGNYSSIQGSSNRPGNLSNGSEIGPDTNPGNYSNLHQRVMRLAIKDSVWYLCNIMHILFGGRTLVCSEGPWHQVGVGNKPRKDIKDINGYQANVVLLEATRDVLLRLVIKCQRKMKNNNSERESRAAPV